MPMMKDDKRNLAAIIVRRIQGKEDAGEMRESNERMTQASMNDGAEIQSDVGMESAAEEVMQAIESKDPRALMSGIRALVEMIMFEEENREDSEV